MASFVEETGFDRVYNYGVANFGDPDFIWGFLRGLSRYRLVVYPWYESVFSSIAEDRTLYRRWERCAAPSGESAVGSGATWCSGSVCCSATRKLAGQRLLDWVVAALRGGGWPCCALPS